MLRIRAHAPRALAAFCILTLATAGRAAAQLRRSHPFRAAGVEVTLPPGFPPPFKLPSEQDSVYRTDAPNGDRIVIVVSDPELPPDDISERRRFALTMGTTGESYRLEHENGTVRVDRHPFLKVPESPEYTSDGFVFGTPRPPLNGRYQSYVPRSGAVRVVTIRFTRTAPGDPLADLTVGGLFSSVHFLDAGAPSHAVPVGDEHVSVVLPAEFPPFRPASRAAPWVARQYESMAGTHVVMVAFVELPGDFPTPQSRKQALDSVTHMLARDVDARPVPPLDDSPTHLTAEQVFAFAPRDGASLLVNMKTFVPRTGPLRAVMVGVARRVAGEFEPDPVGEEILESVEFTAAPATAANPASMAVPTAPAPATPPKG